MDDLGVAFAAEGVEYSKKDAKGQKQGRNGADGYANAEQGTGRLLRCVGHVAGHLQQQEHQGDGQGGGDLLHQRDQAVEHALVALTGLQLAPFDGVGDDGPGQDVGGGDADAGQHAEGQDEAQAGGGVEGDEHDLHDGPEGHAGDVGPALAPAAGGPLPEGQHHNGGDEDGGHEQVALRFPLHDILQEEEQGGLDDVHGDPGAQVDDQAEDEGAVTERRPQRPQDGWLFEGHVVAPLAGAQEGQPQGQGADQAEDQAHEQHARRVLRREAADDHGRHGEGHQAAQDGEEHAVRCEGGALVVVGGQLRREGKVGHVDEGGGGVEEDVGGSVVDGQEQVALQRRAVPEQGEGQGEGQGSEEQEGPATAPAGAGAVGDVADEGVVDVVPGAPDEDGSGGDAGTNAHDVGQEDGEVGPQDGPGEAEAGIADAVEEFGATR